MTVWLRPLLRNEHAELLGVGIAWATSVAGVERQGESVLRSMERFGTPAVCDLGTRAAAYETATRLQPV